MTDMNKTEATPDMTANSLTPQEPTHPGVFLREEIEYRGITQSRLAEEIGVKPSLLSELVNGKRDFTIEYALLIEAALGIEADYWINLQTNYDKAKARHNSSFMARLAAIRRIAAAF